MKPVWTDSCSVGLLAAPSFQRWENEYERTPSPQVLSTFTRAADAIDLEQAAQVFDILDADGDGTIGLDELRSASHDPVVQDFVERSKCQMLRALLNRDGVEPARARRVLQAVDADLSGKIDRSEWAQFVTALARERVRYLKVLGLCSRRCYWGRGAEENAEEARGWLARGYAFFLGPVVRPMPSGYLEDLAFFTRNWHPVLAIVSRDPDHPFTRAEYAAALLVMNSYSLVGSVAISEWAPSGWRFAGIGFKRTLASFCLVTIPILVIDSLLFYLLACPCVRFERQGRKEEARWRRTQWLFTGLGHAVLLPVIGIAMIMLGVACLALVRERGIFVRDRKIDGQAIALSFVLSILASYLIWPLRVVFREFNLWAGKRRHTCWYRHLFCACMGFGRWSVERDAALLALRMMSPSSGDLERAVDEHVIAEIARLDTPVDALRKPSQPKSKSLSRDLTASIRDVEAGL